MQRVEGYRELHRSNPGRINQHTRTSFSNWRPILGVLVLGQLVVTAMVFAIYAASPKVTIDKARNRLDPAYIPSNCTDQLTAGSNELLVASSTAIAQVTQWYHQLSSAPMIEVTLNSTPKANTKLVLRGILTPTRTNKMGEFDGNVYYETEGKQFHVLLMNSQGYEWVTQGERLVKSGCLSPHYYPPFQSLPTYITSASWGLPTYDHATSSRSVMFQFADEVYSIQPLKTTDRRGFQIESEDLIMTLYPTTPTPSHPILDFVHENSMLSSCPKLVLNPTENEKKSVEKSHGKFEICSINTCRFGKYKRCLFVHGIGVHRDEGVMSSYSDYWGTIEKHLPCCMEVKFTHFNTVDAPWYSELFAQRLCDAIVSVATNQTFHLTNDSKQSALSRSTSSKYPPTAANTVVIAHSTGNLHVASALLYKKCRLDPATSQWIAIQGPFRGTNTATTVVEECDKPYDSWSTLVKSVLQDFQLCPATNSTISLVLAGSYSSIDNKCLNELYLRVNNVYHDHVNATLCGVSPFGLTTTSSPKFVALAKFSNHSSTENDGVVVFSSCAGVQDNDTTILEHYKLTYTSRFYKASINHDDGRLIHGDGIWGKTRKPIKWLQCQF